MGGPGSGRREGNPAENRKKKAKQYKIDFRCSKWQFDKITAEAEAAGMDRSTYILTKLEVSMKLLPGVYAEVKKTNVPHGYYFRQGNWEWGKRGEHGVTWLSGTVTHAGFDYYDVIGPDGKAVGVCENGKKFFLKFGGSYPTAKALTPPKGLETFKVD